MTTTLTIAAGCLIIGLIIGSIFGIAASSSHPPSKPSNYRLADTIRMDFLDTSQFGLFYNDKVEAWAVIGKDGKPIGAKLSVRAAIDRAVEVSNGRG